jgi:hypothetical protein
MMKGRGTLDWAISVSAIIHSRRDRPTNLISMAKKATTIGQPAGKVKYLPASLAC